MQIKESTCVLNKKEASPLWKALKLVDLFIYIGSNISSTESDINIRLAKATDRLAIE